MMTKQEGLADAGKSAFSSSNDAETGKFNTRGAKADDKSRL